MSYCAMLYNVFLFYVVHCLVVLCCTVSYCAMLYSVLLFYVVQCFVVLHGVFFYVVPCFVLYSICYALVVNVIRQIIHYYDVVVPCVL